MIFYRVYLVMVPFLLINTLIYISSQNSGRTVRLPWGIFHQPHERTKVAYHATSIQCGNGGRSGILKTTAVFASSMHLCDSLVTDSGKCPGAARLFPVFSWNRFSKLLGLLLQDFGTVFTEYAD